jgi:preprotein translocase subunit SecG
LIYVLYAFHVLVCLFLILVVLLQQGKGADLSVFGGGATQAAFGARGAASLLHKLTVWGFVAFIFTTVTIGFMTSTGGSSSVLSDLPATEAEVPVVEELAVEELVEEAVALDEEAAAVEAAAEEAVGDGNVPEEATESEDGGDS